MNIIKILFQFIFLLTLILLTSGCILFFDSPIESPIENVIFINLDNVKEDLIKNVTSEFENTFNVKTEIRKENIDFQQAYNPEREQYDTGKIIKQIDLTPSKNERVILFTNKNIYSEGLNYVFSSVNISRNIILVSTYILERRLYINQTLSERTLKTLYKGFGVSLGFTKITRDRNCVMAYSNNVDELDAKGIEFCGKRKEHLKKLGMYNIE